MLHCVPTYNRLSACWSATSTRQLLYGASRACCSMAPLYLRVCDISDEAGAGSQARRVTRCVHGERVRVRHARCACGVACKSRGAVGEEAAAVPLIVKMDQTYSGTDQSHTLCLRGSMIGVLKWARHSFMVHTAGGAIGGKTASQGLFKLVAELVAHALLACVCTVRNVWLCGACAGMCMRVGGR